jgi:hypothetical protein
VPGQAEWDAVEAVLKRLEIAVADGEGQGLGQLADYYLDMTCDTLTQATMQPSEELAEIAQEMREL